MNDNEAACRIIIQALVMCNCCVWSHQATWCYFVVICGCSLGFPFYFGNCLSCFFLPCLAKFPACVIACPAQMCCTCVLLSPLLFPVFLCQLIWIPVPICLPVYQQAWLNLAWTFRLPFILHCGSFSSSVLYIICCHTLFWMEITEMRKDKISGLII